MKVVLPLCFGPNWPPIWLPDDTHLSFFPSEQIYTSDPNPFSSELFGLIHPTAGFILNSDLSKGQNPFAGTGKLNKTP